jgi:hypothetical protein
MQITGIRKEIQALKKEYAPNFKTIEELLKSDVRSLSDYELYRLIRHETPTLKCEVELTEEELKNLSDDELLKIINGEYNEPAAY